MVSFSLQRLVPNLQRTHVGRVILRCIWTAEAWPPMWPAEQTPVWAGVCARGQGLNLCEKPDLEPHLGSLASCDQGCFQQVQNGKAPEPRRRPGTYRTVRCRACAVGCWMFRRTWPGCGDVRVPECLQSLPPTMAERLFCAAGSMSLQRAGWHRG